MSSKKIYTDLIIKKKVVTPINFDSNLHQVWLKFVPCSAQNVPSSAQSCSKFETTLLQLLYRKLNQTSSDHCADFVPISVTTWNKCDTKSSQS